MWTTASKRFGLASRNSPGTGTEQTLPKPSLPFRTAKRCTDPALTGPRPPRYLRGNAVSQGETELVEVPVDSTTFRSVLGQWPSGVCVVTTIGPHGVHGMTASSFSSVSLDPPMVSVCLGNHLPSHALLGAAGRFAISFLGKDQAHIGRRFAGQDREITDRFAGLEWITTPNGCPVLADAVAWLDCRVAHAYPGGDHTIFVGEVTGAATPRVISPLLFHSRNWGQLADPLPATIRLAVDAPPPDHAGCVPDAFDPDREDDVLDTIGRLAALGLDEIVCVESETTAASPLQVRRVLQDAVVRVRPNHLRVRLNGRNRLALVNALVAMKSGVSRFDVVTADSGLAGLPIDDLLHLAHQLEVDHQLEAETGRSPGAAAGRRPEAHHRPEADRLRSELVQSRTDLAQLRE
ncbi:flavin reductase [Actinoplanes sp. HUAS TT8]|uniref:flavin reductase n=1 Tax=Actinoplanes sp. HUAS TT8 TaxID=3447453 RepID=UPI003F51C95D